MEKIICSKVYIFATAAITALWVMSLPISDEFLFVVFLLTVSLLGIPHGAMDALLATSFDYKNKVTGLFGFFIAYSVVATVSIAIWLQFPGAALVAFLIVSTYHFSQDWRHMLSFFARLNLATLVLSGPTIFYSKDVTEIFQMLGIESPASVYVVQGMQTIFFISLITAVFLFKQYWRMQNSWRTWEIPVLVVSAVALPPLLHFTLYFCLLHSFKHMLDIFQNQVSSVKQILIFAVPTILVTYLGMYVAYKLLPPISVEENVMKIVFIGLFGLTMSHMVVIHCWHRRLSV